MPTNNHYDVIIIGTGAGGGTLAYKLAPTGKKILILERGGFVPREKDNWSSRAVVLDAKYNTREQLSDDFTRLGLKPFHVPLGIMLDEKEAHKSKCIRCNTCDGFPCLVQAKSDAHVVCVEPALEYPNVTLLTNSLVARLETSPSGR